MFENTYYGSFTLAICHTIQAIAPNWYICPNIGIFGTSLHISCATKVEVFKIPSQCFAADLCCYWDLRLLAASMQKYKVYLSWDSQTQLLECTLFRRFFLFLTKMVFN